GLVDLVALRSPLAEKGNIDHLLFEEVRALERAELLFSLPLNGNSRGSGPCKRDIDGALLVQRAMQEGGLRQTCQGTVRALSIENESNVRLLANHDYPNRW